MKMISSLNLTDFNTNFNFYLNLGLQCTNVQRFVQYTLRKIFNSFVLSVVDARRAGDKNPSSGVVAKRIKLLGNRFMAIKNWTD